MKKIILTILFIIYIAGFIFIVFSEELSGFNIDTQLLAGGWIILGGILFLPIKNKIKNQVKNLYYENKKSFKILIYGVGRSGKSTTINNIFKLCNPEYHREKSTEAFSIQEGYVTLLNNKKYNIAIADYKGQKQSQILSDTHEHQNFFGAKEDRQINAILFIVDMFSEEKDDNDIPVSDQEILNRYQYNSDLFIKKKAEDNNLYINRYNLGPVFDVAYNSENLRSVRLLINKADLLETLINNGNIKSVTSTYDYATSLYADTIQSIKSYCDKNKINDFSTYVISAKNGLYYDKDSKPKNISYIFNELLVNYDKSTDIQEIPQ